MKKATKSTRKASGTVRTVKRLVLHNLALTQEIRLALAGRVLFLGGS